MEHRVSCIFTTHFGTNIGWWNRGRRGSPRVFLWVRVLPCTMLPLYMSFYYNLGFGTFHQERGYAQQFHHAVLTLYTNTLPQLKKTFPWLLQDHWHPLKRRLRPWGCRQPTMRF